MNESPAKLTAEHIAQARAEVNKRLDEIVSALLAKRQHDPDDHSIQSMQYRAGLWFDGIAKIMGEPDPNIAAYLAGRMRQQSTSNPEEYAETRLIYECIAQSLGITKEQLSAAEAQPSGEQTANRNRRNVPRR